MQTLLTILLVIAVILSVVGWGLAYSIGYRMANGDWPWKDS